MSSGNGQLDGEQARALAAAVAAQKAVAAVEAKRLPELRVKRDGAFLRALRVGVPAQSIANETGLTKGRIAQMRSQFRDDGLIAK